MTQQQKKILIVDDKSVNRYILSGIFENEYDMQDVPVVLISANVNDENIHKAYSYEVADYIQKPFQEPVVKRRVESIIELFEKKQMKAKGSP